MPQVLKDEVRRRIQDAALEVFATHGYDGATMSAIAQRADMAVANLYRYYTAKHDLFAAVVTRDLAERFESLLEQSVQSVSAFVLSDAFAPKVAVETIHSGEADDGSARLLRFWIEHRLAVVILLDRAEGTAYAAYGTRFVERLRELTVTGLRDAHPGVRISNAEQQVLSHVFENTRRTIAAILLSNTREQAIVEAIQAFRSYQVAGLAGLLRWIAAPPEASP